MKRNHLEVNGLQFRTKDQAVVLDLDVTVILNHSLDAFMTGAVW